eukprot:Stramenopile-MAST_4_protein_4388
MQEGDKPWFQSDWFAIFDGFNPPVEDRERSIHWQQMNDNLFPNEDIVAQKRKPVNRSPIGARPSTSPYLMNQYRQAQFEAYLSKLAPDLRKEAIEHGSLFRCRKKTVETHGSAVFPRASFHVPGRNTINRVNKQRELRREQFTAVLYELTERLENERLSPVQHEEEKWDDEVFGDSMVADNEVDLKESSMAEESSQLHLEGDSCKHAGEALTRARPKHSDDDHRTHIKVHLTVKKIRNLDFVRSSVDVRCIIVMEWIAPELKTLIVDCDKLWTPTMDILNADEMNKTSHVPWFFPEEGLVRQVIEFEGTVSNEANFYDFPFETDKIAIIVVSEIDTGDENVHMSYMEGKTVRDICPDFLDRQVTDIYSDRI